MKKRQENYRFFKIIRLKNKKGLSLIITLLMVILLIFVAIGIVWFVVENFLSEGTEGITLGKFNLDLEINDVVVGENDITVNVKRNPGEGDFVGIKFIYYAETNSENTENLTVLDVFEQESFTFILTDLTLADIEKVSIAPIYESDFGGTSVGSITDTYIIGLPGGGDDENGGEIDPETCDAAEDPTFLGICGVQECGTGQNGTCAPVTCGTCEGTDECINDICVVDDCVPETPEVTCGTWVCGDKINNCGEEVPCGTCLEGECIEGECVIEEFVNTGTVGTVWPPGIAMYFDSVDLPTDVDYKHYYVSFPGSSEITCLLIAGYITPFFPEIYDKTHIQFSFPSNIASDDNYEIWATQSGCTDSLL